MNHVKGHQDHDIPYDDLDLPPKLNVKADHLRREFREEHTLDTSQIHDRVTEGNLKVYIHGSNINGPH
eukprot:5996153-Ditylum_brightwellii.AAC.1